MIRRDPVCVSSVPGLFIALGICVICSAGCGGSGKDPNRPADASTGTAGTGGLGSAGSGGGVTPTGGSGGTTVTPTGGSGGTTGVGSGGTAGVSGAGGSGAAGGAGGGFGVDAAAGGGGAIMRDAAIGSDAAPDAGQGKDAARDVLSDGQAVPDVPVSPDAGDASPSVDGQVQAPSVAGCSDGTREGFVDPVQNRFIAACAGGFQSGEMGLVDQPKPQCSRGAGNSSANPSGNGCAATDLCAAGWRLCETPSEVKNFSYAGGCGGVEAEGFFPVNHPPATTCSTTSEFQGCGTWGAAASASCAPMTRLSGSLTASALPSPWSITKYNGLVKPSADGGGVLCCRSPADDLSVVPRLAVSRHVCAIAGTTLRCWGKNDHGQLGFTGADSKLPVAVPGDWISVAAGEAHTCAIKTDASLWCWGNNAKGALGLGNANAVDVPTPTKVGDGYTQVALGNQVSCGLKTDGKIWCWGDPATKIPPASATVGVPAQVLYSVYPNLTFDRLSMAGNRAIVTNHRMDSLTGSLSSTTRIDRIYHWGAGNSTSVTGLDDYVRMERPLLTVSQGKSAYCYNGDPRYYGEGGIVCLQTDSASYAVPKLDRALEKLGVGDGQVCAIDVLRDLYCVGANDVGQLGTGAWRKDSGAVQTVDSWQRVYGQRGVWAEVAANTGITCARRLDDSVWCWGNNAWGALGDGSTVSRSYPAQAGEAAPISCTDGVSNGNETKVDCGGDCPPCPTCSDGIQNQGEEGIDCGGPCGGNCCSDGHKNQKETDVDCGGGTCGACTPGKACLVASDCGCTLSSALCAKACTGGLCTSWCADADGDGYGSAGPGCLGPDCDDTDKNWHENCWIRDTFPSTRPATVTKTATISKSDQECVVVFTGAACVPQNSPDCSRTTGTETVNLKLTIDANNKLTVEAPYQDMCAPDYFCAVSGPSCPVPTSYDVPTISKVFTYQPRNTDKCRSYPNGSPYPVDQRVNVSASETGMTIEQTCLTHFLVAPTGSPYLLTDQRTWTTTIKL